MAFILQIMLNNLIVVSTDFSPMLKKVPFGMQNQGEVQSNIHVFGHVIS